MQRVVPCQPHSDLSVETGMPVCVCVCLHSGVVDACLIPEVPFRMDKLAEYVEERFASQGHCVVCVAEGAGQVRAHRRPTKHRRRAQLSQ